MKKETKPQCDNEWESVAKTNLDSDHKSSTDQTGDVNHRWSSEQDKASFDILNAHCAQKGISLQQFLTYKGISQENDEILRHIADTLGWRRKTDYLLLRIQKLVKDSSKFSVRDLRLFKRILRNQLRNRALNYEELLKHFPGKTFDVVKELADKLEKTY